MSKGSSNIESLADMIAARPLKKWAREIKTLGGATVHFRELTAEGIDVFLEMGQAGDQASFRRPEIVRLLRQTLCDSSGKLLASTDDQLNALAWEVVQELFQAAVSCMGLGKAELEEKKTD